MANSVDPDQTASSWSALFAETYPSQYIGFVRYQHLFKDTGDFQLKLLELTPKMLL